MLVRDLIELLHRQDPGAVVVLWDHSSSDKLVVAKLGRGEIQPLQLGAWESNGMLVLEPWAPGDTPLDGPFPGVVLGQP